MSYKQFLKESEQQKIMTAVEFKQKYPGPFNAVTRHAWYKEFFGNAASLGMQVGFRYDNGKALDSVTVAHSAMGTKKLRRMCEFVLGVSKRKVSDVHLFQNWGDDKYSGGSLDGRLRWQHVKSLKEDE